MEPLRIKNEDLPVYPNELVTTGVRKGDARVAYSVDAAGKVDDCLAVAYTHAEFARAAEGAVWRWKFEPARLRGIPVASTADVIMHFEVQGVVVVRMTVSDTMTARFTSLDVLGTNYRARELRELDRIPALIVATPPDYPLGLIEKGHSGNVTVHFYIDESGAVRLPSADLADDPVLTALAINAMSRWRFEPPKCRGAPVLVRADQLFKFSKPK
jgi:TonB family protein